MDIDYFKAGKTAVITINRPRYRNALDVPALKELQTVLEDFESSPGLHAAIITGSGEKSFCAGRDFRSNDLSGAFTGEEARVFPATIMRGLEITKPLIAAVNGMALGGGLELVLCCDLRLAVPEAVFGLPEVTRGLMPGWGGTQRLPRQVPWCVAARMILTGKPVDAAEAYRTGLINEVVPRPELLKTAMEWAESIGRAAPLAVRAAREAMYKGAQLTLEEGLNLELALATYIKTTQDFQEGVQAFKEKRQPDFKGE